MIRYVVICLVLSGCDFVAVKTPEALYDEKTGQQPVLSRKKIDEVLSGLEKIAYSDLDDSYKVYTDPKGSFSAPFANLFYYVIQGDDIYKYIVGKNRIINFLCSDKYFIANRDDIELGLKQYWLVDKQLLYMILDLIYALYKNNYNPYGFKVRESHRHPFYNAKKGGASKSQHIFGTAADLEIEDINNDGVITDEDKQIVLKLLENIVGNKGGMGLYPGTLTIHIDTRGHRARWNQQ